MTKLGRLVKDGKIRSIEEIYLFSLPIKEFQIVEHFLPTLKDEVMKIMPVQKQTQAGQRTRFKAFVIVGDSAGHIGLGVKCSKEVATAIRGAIIAAKLSVIPVRLGFWGAKFGQPHTVPCKVTGKCGSVRFRLIPAPRGTGIVAAGAPKKLLTLAGVDDVYSSSKGCTKTMGNFIKVYIYIFFCVCVCVCACVLCLFVVGFSPLDFRSYCCAGSDFNPVSSFFQAAFDCISKTYSYLSPDLWAPTTFTKSPFQEFTDYLRDTAAGKGKKHA